MKTAHAIFGAVIVAFGAAAFVTFYHEFELRPQTPPHPNAATQKTDSLTPANSIAHDFAVLHTTLASSIAPELADVPKSVNTVSPGAKTPRHPNAATQKADPLTPANSIAHDFAVLSTPANSITPELVDVPKSVQTVPIGRGSTLQLALPAPTQAVAPAPAPPAARVADHQIASETLPSHAEPVDVCARNGGHRVDFMRGHHAMWKCVYKTRRQWRAASMRSLAANGNSRAVELIEKADELDKMIDADPWDTEQVLGGILWRGGWCGGSGGTRSIFLAAAEFGYRSQQLASVTERHSNVLEVLIREIRQDGKADVVSGKALRVLPETELL